MLENIILGYDRYEHGTKLKNFVSLSRVLVKKNKAV